MAGHHHWLRLAWRQLVCLVLLAWHLYRVIFPCSSGALHDFTSGPMCIPFCSTLPATPPTLSARQTHNVSTLPAFLTPSGLKILLFRPLLFVSTRGRDWFLVWFAQIFASLESYFCESFASCILVSLTLSFTGVPFLAFLTTSASVLRPRQPYAVDHLLLGSPAFVCLLLSNFLPEFETISKLKKNIKSIITFKPCYSGKNSSLL